MKRNIRIYYITRIFVGLRFVIPIWATFFLRIITFEQMAVGEVISMVLAAILELPSGALADLIGRKYTTAIGFIIKGIGYVLVTRATNFEGYIVATCFETIGNTFVSGAEDALVYDTLKEQKALGIYAKIKAIESRIYYSSLLLSTILAGYLYNIRAYIPHLLTGITTVLAGITYFFAKEPIIDTEKFNLKGYTKKFKQGFLESFKNKAVAVTSIYYVLLFASALSLAAYFELPFNTWLGFSPKTISWIFGILILLRIVATSFAPKIEKKVSYTKINFLLPLIPGIFLLLTAKNQLWGLIILTIENIFLEFRFIFTQKFYNKQIDSRFRAAALSTLSMLINIIYITVVYGLSKIIGLDRVGLSFNFIGITLIFAALLSLYMRKIKITEE